VPRRATDFVTLFNSDSVGFYLNLPEAWFVFEQKKLERLAEQWCEQKGIAVEWIC